MHDTTSRAVKQESKRKRGFCVKVPLVIISALWGNKDGEETRSDRTRGDRPRLLFGSYGKLGRRRLFHEVCTLSTIDSKCHSIVKTLKEVDPRIDRLHC